MDRWMNVDKQVNTLIDWKINRLISDSEIFQLVVKENKSAKEDVFKRRC